MHFFLEFFELEVRPTSSPTFQNPPGVGRNPPGVGHNPPGSVTTPGELVERASISTNSRKKCIFIQNHIF